MSLLTTVSGLLGSAWHVNQKAVMAALLPAADGTVEANKPLVVDANKRLDTLDLTAIKIGGVAVAATAAEIDRAADVSARVVAVTTSPLAIVDTTHEGKTVTLSLATGIATTLPAATGSGARYRFVILTSNSSTNTYTFAVTGDDTMVGHAFGVDGDGEPGNGWATVAGGSASNKVTMGGSSQASGGSAGDIIEFQDVAADVWSVSIRCVQGGTEVTPFSHV